MKGSRGRQGNIPPGLRGDTRVRPGDYSLVVLTLVRKATGNWTGVSYENCHDIPGDLSFFSTLPIGHELLWILKVDPRMFLDFVKRAQRVQIVHWNVNFVRFCSRHLLERDERERRERETRERRERERRERFAPETAALQSATLQLSHTRTYN
jgi:hypothetical protein